MKLRRWLILFSICISVKALANPVFIPMISKARDSFGVKISNNSNKDMFCEKVSIEVVLRDTDHGEPLGQFPFTFENIYLLEMSTLESTQLIADLGLSTLEANIANIKITTPDCKLASFVNYCEYHPDITQEDQFVLSELFSAKRVDSCKALDAKIGKKLSVRSKGISSFKPFTYLTRLQSLNLKENQLPNLEGVERLMNLRVLLVNGNPIGNIDEAIRLPRIQWVDASRTEVTNINLEGVVKHMRASYRKSGTHVLNTPYSQQFY